LIVAKYMMQVIQLILIFTFMSLLTGMLWWKYCDILETDFGIEGFITENNLREAKFKERVISLVYYMFTTLSTVGLGDFTPTNS